MRWKVIAGVCAWVLAAGCSVGLGEPCDAGTACPEGLVCSFPREEEGPAPRGVCDYPLRGEGEECTVAAECERSLTCSNHFTPGDRYGACVKKRAVGEACFVDRDCESGACEGGSGSALDGVCAAED